MLACVDKKDKATTSSAVLQLQLCGAHGTCLASVCLLSLSFVEFVKDAGRLVASRELHVFTTFARRFYWSDLNIWPEDLAPGSVVLLSGQDDLMDAAEVKDMLDVAGHVKVRTGWGDARQGRGVGITLMEDGVQLVRPATGGGQMVVMGKFTLTAGA